MEKQSYTLEDARQFEKVRDYAKAADIYMNLGDYEKAEQLYRALEQQRPFHKDIKFKLGRLLTIRKQWDEAIIKLQEVGNVGRFAEDMLYLLAECFKQKGLIHAAKEMYVELLDRNYHYKDARKKLQALESPGFFDLAATQHTTVASPGMDAGPETGAQYQTMQGFAVEDRYIVVGELGRGGMGIVYKAEDTLSNRFVAIKVLPPYLATEENNRIRFFREAKLIADLHHPNIISLLEVNQQENFIVMEYIDGGTLYSWKETYTPNDEELITIISQVLDALYTVHQQGIIHRDIKPDNILITKNALAKLTDFGIAHICGATITHTGTHLGTLPYMSPEQIIGKHIDWRSDIYAIGVVLYELFTGKLPFSGKDTSYHHVHTAPPPPHDVAAVVSSELSAIILKCLAKRPEDRLQNVSELQTELSGLQ